MHNDFNEDILFEIKEGIIFNDEESISLFDVERIRYSDGCIYLYFGEQTINRIVKRAEFREIQKEFHKIKQRRLNSQNIY